MSSSAPPLPSQAPSITFYRPAAPLRDSIESYFIFNLDRPARDIVQPGWSHMGWVLEGAWRAGQFGGELSPVPPVAFGGPRERAMVAQGTPGRVIALTLTPLGWTRLVGANASKYDGQTVPMSQVIGPGCEALLPRLREAGDAAALELLDAFFLARLRATRADKNVEQAFGFLLEGAVATVGDWSARLGMSVRQLERLCARHFGLSPKRLLRRQRLLRAIAQIQRDPSLGWSAAIGADYADQPHFVREFRWFMHITPGTWLRRERNLVRRVGKRESPQKVASIQSIPEKAG